MTFDSFLKRNYKYIIPITAFSVVLIGGVYIIKRNMPTQTQIGRKRIRGPKPLSKKTETLASIEERFSENQSSLLSNNSI